MWGSKQGGKTAGSLGGGIVGSYFGGPAGGAGGSALGGAIGSHVPVKYQAVIGVLDSGTPSVPVSGPYQLQAGEKVIPADQNPDNAAGGAADASKQKLDALVQQLLGKATAAQSQLRQPSARSSPDALKQGEYDMGEKKTKGGEIGSAIGNFGTFIHNMAAQHKQRQIQDAMVEWQGINGAYERAKLLAGDPPNGNPNDPQYKQKLMQAFMQDPWAKANLDPANPKNVKRLKNMSKALNFDPLGGDEENVHRQGLLKHLKVQDALKKVIGAKQKRDEHKQQQSQKQAASPQQLQDVIGRIMSQTQVQQPEPKDTEAVAKILESQAGREEALEYRKQAHLDQLQMQQQQLDLRRDQLEQQMQNKQQTMEETTRHNKEMEELRRQFNEIQRDKAATTGDISGLVQAVKTGTPITQIDAKDRSKVIAAFSAEGKRVPQPISPSEQTTLDDAYAQTSKAEVWQETLKQQFSDANGELPNKPGATTWDRVKYKFGAAPPDAALISDFSREKWAAVAGLVKGMRRGDVLKDMTQHTPNPYIDSPKLMYIKLDALKANYSLARATALKDHGFEQDPRDGSNLDDNIKSYENHLKAAKSDIENIGKPKTLAPGAEIP
jgi:hypothetical protein